MERCLKIFIPLIFLAVLGCQKIDLHHGLTEIEVDEIMNLLHQNGIDAVKEKEVSGQEISWKVSVKAGQIHEARRFLVANNLPRRKELGLSGVYKEKGLIPTPDEQKARFLLALKGEIINSLEKIPGVVDVDVVLNVPSEDEFSELNGQQNRPTASVIVRIRSESDSSDMTEGKIQRFVANAVPSLNPNDVTVIISRGGGPKTTSGTLFPSTGGSSLPTTDSQASTRRAEKSGPHVELLGIKIQEGSVGRMRIIFIFLLLVLVVLSAALLVSIVRFNKMKLRVQKGMPVEAVPMGAGQQFLGGGEAAGGGAEGTFDIGRKG
ncbi:MAG: hypothetical protein HYW02_07580 [Deltaproteobacteria bacterium]|nr:hypothetical protein [Deltaproteobacteria bacterium]